jgi:hypothetical protein
MMQLIEIPMPEVSPLMHDFGSVIFFGKIICAVVSTMIYWRQRAAIKRLRVALYAISRETEAPYFDGEVGRDSKRSSWALIHSICATELRAKRW